MAAITGYTLLVNRQRTPDGKKNYLRLTNGKRAIFASGDQALPYLIEFRRNGHAEARLVPARPDWTPNVPDGEALSEVDIDLILKVRGGN